MSNIFDYKAKTGDDLNEKKESISILNNKTNTIIIISTVLLISYFLFANKKRK